MAVRTPPISLRWPQDLFDLYQAKAAELTHLAEGKQRFTVASLAIDALREYAERQEWLNDPQPQPALHKK